MSKKDEILKKDVIDLLNQIMIRLRLNDIKEPEINEKYNNGFNDIPTSFVHDYSDKTSHKLEYIKAVIGGIIKELESKEQFPRHDIEKMARAYYSSFCNA